MQTRKSILIAAIGTVVLGFAVAFELPAKAEPIARIVVEAGDKARLHTPMSIPLPSLTGDARVQLQEIKGGTRVAVPSQIETGQAARLWWILSGTTEPGTQRIYELLPGDSSQKEGVNIVQNDKFLELRQGETKILRYNHAIVPPPPGQDEKYNRGAFIHPLWAPTGRVLTEIHPDDHIHHVGIWMPWTKTTFEGKDVDFWNLNAGQGTVKFVRFLSTTSGAVFGGFQAQQHHVALQTDDGAKVVLDETWDVRVYNVGGPDGGFWLWDLVSKQRCVADSPLHQGKYRYGGFGFRATSEWDEENAAYLTSEGKDRKNGHATRARWCDTAGRIDDHWQGVTFFSHPKNFRHPEPMRIWPEGHVFFNWAPSQIDDWEMKPGEDHVFRYRMFVHEGKIDVAKTEQLWTDFANPPQAKVEFSRPADATVLYDGSGFDRWQRQGGGEIKWNESGDTMTIVPKSGSIVTNKPYKDFQMHIEFKTPQLPPNVTGQGRGNSGVYIQQRYEIQILDSFGLEPKYNEAASIYRFKAPDHNVCKKPGEWQSYDIFFKAARFDGRGADAKKTQNARVTIYHNGVLVHDDVDVPNKTGAGQKEGPDPLPILLQDHGNAVSFRNIWIVPL